MNVFHKIADVFAAIHRQGVTNAEMEAHLAELRQFGAKIESGITDIAGMVRDEVKRQIEEFKPQVDAAVQKARDEIAEIVATSAAADDKAKSTKSDDSDKKAKS